MPRNNRVGHEPFCSSLEFVERIYTRSEHSSQEFEEDFFNENYNNCDTLQNDDNFSFNGKNKILPYTNLGYHLRYQSEFVWDNSWKNFGLDYIYKGAAVEDFDRLDGKVC